MADLGLLRLRAGVVGRIFLPQFPPVAEALIGAPRAVGPLRDRDAALGQKSLHLWQSPAPFAQRIALRYSVAENSALSFWFVGAQSDIRDTRRVLRIPSLRRLDLEHPRAPAHPPRW